MKAPSLQVIVVPNDPAGRAVLAAIRAYTNRATYRVRVCGRGLKPERRAEFLRRYGKGRYGTYQWIPNRYAASLAVYFERKDGITTYDAASWQARYGWKARRDEREAAERAARPVPLPQ